MPPSSRNALKYDTKVMYGSAGFAAGPDEMPVGRPVSPTTFEITIPGDADFNDDGVVDAIDIDLLCAAIAVDPPNLRFDLTGDGSVNSQDHQQMIFGTLGTTYGDSNLDGIFDSSDLVAIFARGKYEDGISQNAGWADGDWNCDSEFDTNDLVLAFQQGGYINEAVDRAFTDWRHA